MPLLTDLGLHHSSYADPRHYPGTTVRSDCLLVPPWLHPLRPVGACPAQWRVVVDGGPAAEAGVRDGAALADVLAAIGAAPLERRRPVLSVGSNAAPAQLRRKLGHREAVLPMTVVSAANLAVGHSAHISAPGYVPYAPRHAPGVTTRLVVLWFDDTQLARVSATEPNYDLVALDPAAVPVTPTGSALPTPLAECLVYRGRHGLLRGEPDGEPWPAGTQQWVYSQFARWRWFVRLLPEIRRGISPAMAAVAADTQRRHAVRRALAEAGLAAADGLPAAERGGMSDDHTT